MRVVVDKTRCSGYASCELAAPDVFRVGLDEVVEVIGVVLIGVPRSTVEGAVRSCPSRALSIVDD